jgi:outer membrane immunogenic protein
MKRFILGVAAALVLSAGQAAADGLPSKGTIKAPAAAAGPDWNGFYVGVGIGAGALVAEKPVYFHHGTTYTSTEYGGEGVFGTVTIGYDRVIRPGWVGGVFVDYDFGSSISSDVYNLPPSTPYYGSSSIDHNYSWSVGARLGFLANAGTLIYATAGYTQAEFDVFRYGSPTFDGYFVGAGVETFLRDNWTLKLEYRYSDFASETVLSKEDRPYIGADLEPSTHTARLVLSYRFGHRD